MALGAPIALRLSLDKEPLLKREAAQQGKFLGAYLREKLEADVTARSDIESMHNELAALRHDIAELHGRLAEPAVSQPPAHDALLTSMLLETLMYWRASVPAQKQQEVRATLESQGLKPWTLPRTGGSNAPR